MALDLTSLLAFAKDEGASDLHVSAGLPPHAPPARPAAPPGDAGAEQGRRPRRHLRRPERRAEAHLRGAARPRLRARDPRRVALPRQRVRAEARRGGGVPRRAVARSRRSTISACPRCSRIWRAASRAWSWSPGRPAPASRPRSRRWSTTSTRRSAVTSSPSRTRSSSCTSRRSRLVNQREVGPHTSSFTNALRAALREDPDVILVGELRDLETTSLAITAAETGHLVFATLHTNSACQDVDRIIDIFPGGPAGAGAHHALGVARGRGRPDAAAGQGRQGRVAALEILVGVPALRNLIREDKTAQILSVIQTGAQHGMQSLDQSLRELVMAGKLSRDEAMQKLVEPAAVRGRGRIGAGRPAARPAAAPAPRADAVRAEPAKKPGMFGTRSDHCARRPARPAPAAGDPISILTADSAPLLRVDGATVPAIDQVLDAHGGRSPLVRACPERATRPRFDRSTRAERRARRARRRALPTQRASPARSVRAGGAPHPHRRAERRRAGAPRRRCAR